MNHANRVADASAVIIGIIILSTIQSSELSMLKEMNQAMVMSYCGY